MSPTLNFFCTQGNKNLRFEHFFSCRKAHWSSFWKIVFQSSRQLDYDSRQQKGKMTVQAYFLRTNAFGLEARHLGGVDSEYRGGLGREEKGPKYLAVTYTKNLHFFEICITRVGRFPLDNSSPFRDYRHFENHYVVWKQIVLLQLTLTLN